MSRGPLREGLQRLTAEGLLESVRNRGLFVVEMTPENVTDMYLARGAVERAAAAQVQQGVAPALVQQQALAALGQAPAFTPEYFEVADAQTLQPLAEYAPGRAVVLCVAAHLGGVRLIDNVVVNP